MKRFILLFSLLFAFHTLTAQSLIPHHGTVSGSYNFWLYTPQGYHKDSVAKPLVVFLHGRSLCGRDLNRVRRYGPLNAIEMGMKIDAVVLAPQNPGAGWNPAKVIKLVDWVEQHYAVDTNRVYVLGMSLGGYGTLDVAASYPHRFAAAMALCGGATCKDLCGLNKMPLWILHGTADRAVSVKASQRVVDAMRSCGASKRLIWTPLQGMNHGSLARAFYLPQTYQWLFSHSLADTNRPVNRNYDISPNSLTRNAYRSARQGGKVEVVHNEPEATGDRSEFADLSEHSAAVEHTEPVETNHEATTHKASSQNDSPKYHKVKKGETLSAIARKNHTTVKKLCKLNGIKETTTLKVGRRLRVK